MGNRGLGFGVESSGRFGVLGSDSLLLRLFRLRDGLFSRYRYRLLFAGGVLPVLFAGEAHIVYGSGGTELIGSGEVGLGTTGADQFSINVSDFNSIDGGGGLDTLTSTVNLDFTSDISLRTRIQSIEVIDLDAIAEVVLSLSRVSVFGVSGNVDEGRTTLTVNGDALDAVIFEDSDIWIQNVEASASPEGYFRYTSGTAVVFIADVITMIENIDMVTVTLNEPSSPSNHPRILEGVDASNIYQASVVFEEMTMGVKYSIIEVADDNSDLFAIDSVSGVVSLKTGAEMGFDYESGIGIGEGGVNEYIFGIMATSIEDPRVSDSQTLTISVMDDLGEAIEIGNMPASEAIDIGVENVGFDFTAHDLDASRVDGAGLSYTIVGDEQGLFTVEGGIVGLIEGGFLDYEGAGITSSAVAGVGHYSFTVEVSSAGADTSISSAVFTLSVSNVDELSVASASLEASVVETESGISNNFGVIDLGFIDDSMDFRDLTYSITDSHASNDISGAFRVDRFGNLRLREGGVIDYDEAAGANNEHVLVIEAMAGLDEATVRVMVTVSDDVVTNEVRLTPHYFVPLRSDDISRGNDLETLTVSETDTTVTGYERSYYTYALAGEESDIANFAVSSGDLILKHDGPAVVSRHVERGVGSYRVFGLDYDKLVDSDDSDGSIDGSSADPFLVSIIATKIVDSYDSAGVLQIDDRVTTVEAGVTLTISVADDIAADIADDVVANFTAEGSGYDVSNFGRKLMGGNFNGNIYSDLLLVSGDGLDNRIFIEDGSGTRLEDKGFVGTDADISRDFTGDDVESYVVDIAVGELDNDGKDDYAILNYVGGESEVQVRLSTGAGLIDVAGEEALAISSLAITGGKLYFGNVLGGTSHAGEVRFIEGFDSTADDYTVPTSLSLESEVISAPEGSYFFGRSLSGYGGGLLVGDYSIEVAAYLYSDSNDDGTLSVASTFISGADRDVLTRSAGFKVSNLGDINGDSLDDIFIAERDISGFVGGYVVFGESEPSAVIDLSRLDGDDGFYLSHLQSSDILISSGDYNGDSLNDLLARGVDGSYIIFGRSTGWSASFALHAGADLRLDGTDVSSLIFVGDVDGDGSSDIAVGSSADEVRLIYSEYKRFVGGSGDDSFMGRSNLPDRFIISSGRDVVSDFADRDVLDFIGYGVISRTVVDVIGDDVIFSGRSGDNDFRVTLSDSLSTGGVFADITGETKAMSLAAELNNDVFSEQFGNFGGDVFEDVVERIGSPGRDEFSDMGSRFERFVITSGFSDLHFGIEDWLDFRNFGDIDLIHVSVFSFEDIDSDTMVATSVNRVEFSGDDEDNEFFVLNFFRASSIFNLDVKATLSEWVVALNVGDFDNSFLNLGAVNFVYEAEVFEGGLGDDSFTGEDYGDNRFVITTGEDTIDNFGLRDILDFRNFGDIDRIFVTLDGADVILEGSDSDKKAFHVSFTDSVFISPADTSANEVFEGRFAMPDSFIISSGRDIIRDFASDDMLDFSGYRAISRVAVDIIGDDVIFSGSDGGKDFRVTLEDSLSVGGVFADSGTAANLATQLNDDRFDSYFTNFRLAEGGSFEGVIENVGTSADFDFPNRGSVFERFVVKEGNNSLYFGNEDLLDFRDYGDIAKIQVSMGLQGRFIFSGSDVNGKAFNLAFNAGSIFNFITTATPLDWVINLNAGLFDDSFINLGKTSFVYSSGQFTGASEKLSRDFNGTSFNNYFANLVIEPNLVVPNFVGGNIQTGTNKAYVNVKKGRFDRYQFSDDGVDELTGVTGIFDRFVISSGADIINNFGIEDVLDFSSYDTVSRVDVFVHGNDVILRGEVGAGGLFSLENFDVTLTGVRAEGRAFEVSGIVKDERNAAEILVDALNGDDARDKLFLNIGETFSGRVEKPPFVAEKLIIGDRNDDVLAGEANLPDRFIITAGVDAITGFGSEDVLDFSGWDGVKTVGVTRRGDGTLIFTGHDDRPFHELDADGRAILLAQPLSHTKYSEIESYNDRDFTVELRATTGFPAPSGTLDFLYEGRTEEKIIDGLNDGLYDDRFLNFNPKPRFVKINEYGGTAGNDVLTGDEGHQRSADRFIVTGGRDTIIEFDDEDINTGDRGDILDFRNFRGLTEISVQFVHFHRDIVFRSAAGFEITLDFVAGPGGAFGPSIFGQPYSGMSADITRGIAERLDAGVYNAHFANLDLVGLDFVPYIPDDLI